MGSLFGGLLAERGARVTLVDINAAHIEAIRAHGLRLETDGGDRRVRLEACRPEAVNETPDLVILFTKAMHTDAALAGIARWVGPQTRILSLQNGLGNRERVAAVVGDARTVIGMTTCPGDLCGPGHVASHGHGKTRLMRADGVADVEVEAIAAGLRDAGLDCEVDPAVATAIWEKVAFNAALNSICAVVSCEVGWIEKTPAALTLALAAVDEVLAVAAAEGVPVNGERVHATVRQAIHEQAGHKPSMLQDVLAGRPTEVESLNGAVLAIGERHGIAAPNIRALLALVRLVETVRCRGT